MKKDPFKEYFKEPEPGKRDKQYAWYTAIGLQAVDGLKTSEYLARTAVRNIEGEISFDEANVLLQNYYKENSVRDAEDRTEEADKVFARIAALLSERAFSFTPNSILRFTGSCLQGSILTQAVSGITILQKKNGYLNDLKNDIHETTEYLELFLRNLLLNEQHPLYNRTLHVSGAFEKETKPDIESKKPDIETAKPDIEAAKVDIKKQFQFKTINHILMLYRAFPRQTIFGRSDVMNVIGIKPSRASELLKAMAEYGVIEPVSGHGKGKYRFRRYYD